VPRIGSLRDSRSLASRAAYRVVARIPSLAPRPGHCPLQPTRSRNRRLPRRLRRRLGPRGQPSGLPPAQRHRRHAHDHPATHTKPSQCRTRPPPQPRRQTVAWGQWRQRLKRHLGRMLRRPQLLRRRDQLRRHPGRQIPRQQRRRARQPDPHNQRRDTTLCQPLRCPAQREPSVRCLCGDHPRQALGRPRPGARSAMLAAPSVRHRQPEAQTARPRSRPTDRRAAPADACNPGL